MLRNTLTNQHKRLYAWYHVHGRRDLPWRNTRDPYAIWISEVMLQQTQVQTVVSDYYPNFLQAFPTIKHLADASLEEVLNRWQGLGYYRRAKHLHEAARQTSPALPETVEGLMALPGIGKNTAHSIGAFAYGLAVPVMEANVKRVLSRLFALPNPTEKALWELAYRHVDPTHPFDYNQAMMDIGAMVCTDKAPACSTCPLRLGCAGQANPLAFPEKKKQKKVPTKSKVIVVLGRDNHAGEVEYYMTKRRSAFLHGLYRFIEEGEVVDYAKKSNSRRELGLVKHSYSHFKLEATVYHMVWDSSFPTESKQGWFTLEAIQRLPVSKVEEEILTILETEVLSAEPLPS